jgi:hypothetical protein
MNCPLGIKGVSMYVLRARCSIGRMGTQRDLARKGRVGERIIAAVSRNAMRYNIA